MKQRRQLAWSLVGALLAVAALIAFVVIQSGKPSSVSGPGDGSSRLQGEGEGGEKAGSEPALARPKTKRPAAGHSEVSRRLLDLRDGKDRPAIHEELATLADAGRLSEAETVLRGWCRADDLELAQWALQFSGQVDPPLHLVLCAEALSHRSDVIRDSAAAELEQASGTRFEDSAQAFLWLDEKKREK